MIEKHYRTSHGGKHFYEVLGISPNASGREILNAYARKTFSVIKNRDEDEESSKKGTDRLRRIFATLNDPDLRYKYDKKLQECNQQKDKTGPNSNNDTCKDGHRSGSKTHSSTDCNSSGKCESSKKVYGITLSGKECKRCIRQGSYCFQHSFQDQAGSDKIDVVVKVFGYTLQGLPCKRCINQGEFCYQHTRQQFNKN